jgi:hypothetical protein
MRYTIDQIEDLLVARIAAELPYLNTVDTFEAKYDVTLERLIHHSPAVFAALNSVKPSADLESFGVGVHIYTFELGIVCRDLRGPKEGRRGDEGAYQILDDLYAALEGHRLSQGIEPLEFEGLEFVLSTNIGVVYRATYTLAQAGG